MHGRRQDARRAAGVRAEAELELVLMERSAAEKSPGRAPAQAPASWPTGLARARASATGPEHARVRRRAPSCEARGLRPVNGQQPDRPAPADARPRPTSGAPRRRSPTARQADRAQGLRLPRPGRVRLLAAADLGTGRGCWSPCAPVSASASRVGSRGGTWLSTAGLIRVSGCPPVRMMEPTEDLGRCHGAAGTVGCSRHGPRCLVQCPDVAAVVVIATYWRPTRSTWRSPSGRRLARSRRGRLLPALQHPRADGGDVHRSSISASCVASTRRQVICCITPLAPNSSVPLFRSR